ncbi:MAG: 50S ribosomal protein L23 [Deltaproteobacteria bacterium RBG_13_52_11]|nr:MAG: 50S ribosomal protein L23 [Deltaproteobacteria bacterium RBG_13_52_11]
MRDIYQVIKKPLITEKANILKEKDNKVAFVVDRAANKAEIKAAVERLLKVKVLKVHVSNMKGKPRRVGRNIGKRPDWKKAVVTLKPGDRIEFFEGA